jgi:Ser/Thr protein kinase RdoA (MazF antagonist)
MKTTMLQIGQQFTKAGITEITPLGNGLINDTFLVKTNKKPFVLQRINAQVFPKPKLILENLLLLNQHIRKKKVNAVKLKVPDVIKTINNEFFYIDQKNDFWRSLQFVNHTVSRELISTLDEAEQVGFALAHFHCLLSDANIKSFNDTLPGFHITSGYFQHYLRVENQCESSFDSLKVDNCRKFILKFQSRINVLEDARQKGWLTERIIHGDPKFNNFLFDEQSDRIISLIDLDTVKPGLVHYDIADCLRSCCHIHQSNTFDLEIFRVILSSYLNQADFFTSRDYQFLYPAIQLIPFELGLRFFIDYLEDNCYFKVDYPEQNLDKATAQFELCSCITSQESEIKQIIAMVS